MGPLPGTWGLAVANVPSQPTQRPRRPSTLAGVIGIFGVAAGLGAVLGLIVTIIEWREEVAQAHWPVVTAVVQSSSVDSYRTSKQGTVWRLRCHVRYAADWAEHTATLSSRSVQSDADITAMRLWAAQHRRDTSVDVRYDPDQPSHIVFATDDVPGAGPRTGTNVTITLAAATICALCLAFARHFGARQAGASNAPGSQSWPGSQQATPGTRIVMGVIFAACGVLPIVLGTYSALHATHPLTSADFIFAPIALVFVIAGALVALPPRDDATHRLLATLLLTFFAATFDWVAFGPGERHFSGGIGLGIGGVGFSPGETFGRTVFGIVAVLIDVWAIAMWVGQIRAWLRP